MDEIKRSTNIRQLAENQRVGGPGTGQPPPNQLPAMILNHPQAPTGAMQPGQMPAAPPVIIPIIPPGANTANAGARDSVRPGDLVPVIDTASTASAALPQEVRKQRVDTAIANFTRMNPNDKEGYKALVDELIQRHGKDAVDHRYVRATFKDYTEDLSGYGASPLTLKDALMEAYGDRAELKRLCHIPEEPSYPRRLTADEDALPTATESQKYISNGVNNFIASLADDDDGGSEIVEENFDFFADYLYHQVSHLATMEYLLIATKSGAPRPEAKSVLVEAFQDMSSSLRMFELANGDVIIGPMDDRQADTHFNPATGSDQENSMEQIDTGFPDSDESELAALMNINFTDPAKVHTPWSRSSSGSDAEPDNAPSNSGSTSDSEVSEPEF